MWLLFLLACTNEPGPPSCAERFADLPRPRSNADIEAYVAIAQPAFYPELDGVPLRFVELIDDASFFAANLDVTTLENPPLERQYQIQVNPLLLADPPTPAAAGAILVHELRHIADYTQMDATELGEFAVAYALGEVGDYERQTDLATLEHGCGEGLIGYREWLYERLTPEQEAAKRDTYYTPEEIEAWMADNP